MIIGIDVSATHTTVGFTKNGKLEINSYKTANVKSITEVIPAQTKKLCIGAAGIITKQGVKLSNAKLAILRSNLPKGTLLVNDFSLYAYALNTKIRTKLLLGVTRGSAHKDKLVIGAGTGLGFCFARYIGGAYVPHSTEAGQTDAVLFEPDLLAFCMKKGIRPKYEDFLSGRGLTLLAEFCDPLLYKKALTYEDPAEYIASTKSKRVFGLFATLYARFIKNASYFLPFGGIYIAGGIAQKNPWMFALPEFHEEMSRLAIEKPILSTIPIYLILDYNTSVKGALWAASRL
jgi:glucokinase